MSFVPICLPVMPSRIEFARRAIADLEAIEEHGRRVHGTDQANQYRESLLDDMAMLLEFPNAGRDDAARGLRRKSCGVHVIWYRVDGAVLKIIRILHQRMDSSRRL